VDRLRSRVELMQRTTMTVSTMPMTMTLIHTHHQSSSSLSRAARFITLLLMLAFSINQHHVDAVPSSTVTPSSSSSSSSSAATVTTTDTDTDTEADNAAASLTPLACQNGGVLLQRQDNEKRRMYMCACQTGWTGKTCEHRDWCMQAESDPCGSHGVCLNTLNGVYCRCDVGWVGMYCDQRNPCQGRTCSGHGRCALVATPTPSDSTSKQGGDDHDAEVEHVKPVVDSPYVADSLKKHGKSKRHPHSTPMIITVAKETEDDHDKDKDDQHRSKDHDHRSHDQSKNETAASDSHDQQEQATPVLPSAPHLTAQCICDKGWAGSDCSDSHSSICSSIQACNVLTAQNSSSAEGGGCGCQEAMKKGCAWCLSEGYAFTPRADGKKQHHDEHPCRASTQHLNHCPSPDAQSIHSCSLMSGTPFGWCHVGLNHGYAMEGNPSSPKIGSAHCHAWIWAENGCKEDWTTGTLGIKHKEHEDKKDEQKQKETPQEVCAQVPLCNNADTASYHLCGCQAALSLGCQFCAETQRSYARSTNHSTTGCHSLIRHPSACPSQQAQTIHSCRGIGEALLKFGWCSSSTSHPLQGYARDGTRHGPACGSKVEEKHCGCKKWTFRAQRCPHGQEMGGSMVPNDSTGLDEAQTAAAAAAKNHHQHARSHLHDAPTSHDDGTRHSHPYHYFHARSFVMIATFVGLSGLGLGVCWAHKRSQRRRRAEYFSIRSLDDVTWR